jgi:4-hydroxy-tetrahydrodipicolinate reductase
MKHAVNEHNGALFYASNFSLGVNLFFEMNKQVAKMMNQYPQYDVDVHEIHHTQKKDAPSGTAISIAEGIVSEVDRKHRYGLDETANEVLKITAARQDPTPGTHIVKYKSEVDDIQLIHTAYSRKGFAEGAVLAAEFIINKKGMYGMQDLLNLNAK